MGEQVLVDRLWVLLGGWKEIGGFLKTENRRGFFRWAGRSGERETQELRLSRNGLIELTKLLEKDERPRREVNEAAADGASPARNCTKHTKLR
jgi:hypothetical protein